jgi:hypothetical protein
VVTALMEPGTSSVRQSYLFAMTMSVFEIKLPMTGSKPARKVMATSVLVRGK